MIISFIDRYKELHNDLMSNKNPEDHIKKVAELYILLTLFISSLGYNEVKEEIDRILKQLSKDR